MLKDLTNMGPVSRDDAARAVADHSDPNAVPVPVRLRLPFERAARWVVLDARKLPAAQLAAQ